MRIISLVFCLLLSVPAWADNSPFLGTWKSNWGGAINTTFVVSSVSGDKASITYSWAKSSYGPAGSVSATAKIKGNKLTFVSGYYGFEFQDKGGTLKCWRTYSQDRNTTTFRRAN